MLSAQTKYNTRCDTAEWFGEVCGVWLSILFYFGQVAPPISFASSVQHIAANYDIH